MKLFRLCPPAIFIPSYVYNTHTQFVQFFINNNNNGEKKKKSSIIIINQQNKPLQGQKYMYNNTHVALFINSSHVLQDTAVA
jgi:hypothetical protein